MGNYQSRRLEIYKKNTQILISVHTSAFHIPLRGSQGEGQPEDSTGFMNLLLPPVRQRVRGEVEPESRN